MTKKFFFILAVTWLLASACNREKTAYVLIETEFGNMKAMLYNSTPKHRDNFLKLAGEGYYNDLLFHRVIRGFMIQGGDPDSRNAAPGAMLGMGGPGYTIDAEIGAPHLKGVLAAARDMNPAKASSGSQFYIVQGQPVDDGTLTGLEQQKGFTYNPTQRQLYKEIGGAPFLDGDYTVFGEVVEGIEVIDKIAAVPTATADRPIADVKMKISVISNPF
jgi:cyclophilin family peptidyl-prolyl cis-trans isomerase